MSYDPVPRKKERKMKKVLSGILISLILFSMTGCFRDDNMEGITVYTTAYPITYITERLYGEHSNVLSIFPRGVDINNHKLTEKQVSDFSKAGLFIFSEMRPEKDYALRFYNHNRNIRIIDATRSMEVKHRFEELWLDPSNLLMIARNIKNGLNEYITSHYIRNSILQNYEILKLELSNLDAQISLIRENAENITIITSSNLFRFFTKYGFNVISLEGDTITDRTLQEAKDEIRRNNIGTIFVPMGEVLSGHAKAIADEFNLKTSYLHTLSNITEEEENNRKNYFTIMLENLDKLKDELYK